MTAISSPSTLTEQWRLRSNATQFECRLGNQWERRNWYMHFSSDAARNRLQEPPNILVVSDEDDWRERAFGFCCVVAVEGSESLSHKDDWVRIMGYENPNLPKRPHG